MGYLFAFFVHIINAEEGAGEGGGFAEGYKEGFVDLSLRVDEDAAEEQDQTSEGEDKGGYKLQVVFHGGFILLSDTIRRN